MSAARASQVALVVKNPPASARGMRNIGSLPGWEESLEKEMAADSRILPGETCGQRGCWRCSQTRLEQLSPAQP